MDPQPEKPPAFDDYASNYAELIRDPIREKFADGNRFFFQRKIEVILAFFNRAGIRSATPASCADRTPTRVVLD